MFGLGVMASPYVVPPTNYRSGRPDNFFLLFFLLRMARIAQPL